MSLDPALSRIFRQVLRHPHPWVRFSGIAVIALVSVLLGWNGFQARSGPAASGGNPSASLTRSGYETLPGARLVEHRNNDGDSFRVRQGNREFELRLYFVDAPEKYLNDRYPEQRARVADQARELKLPVDETITLGQKARDFVRDLLAGRTFTIYTKWERVYDSERFHGFVELPDPDHPGRSVYLCELLMRRGLARVHTKGADTPDGRSMSHYRDSLLQLQHRHGSALRQTSPH